jgi:hypothetical protein
MASKRHRTLKPARTNRDKMAVAHRQRLEKEKRVELDTQMAGSRPVPASCAPCNERFYAADLNPVCPFCGQPAIRRTR